MTDFTVRPMQSKDLNSVSALFNSYRVFYKKESDINLAKAFIEERFQKEQSVIFVAQMSDSTIGGFAQLYPVFSSVSARRAWIFNDLYVSEQCRNQGVGGQLIDSSLDFCRENDAAYLTLETGTDNFQAKRLYEKRGFLKGTGYDVYSHDCSK